MRPKVIFYLLLAIECLFLHLASEHIAPRLSKVVLAERPREQYVQTPNAETKQALENLKADRKEKQAWLLGSAAGVLAVMIIYGWKNKARI